MRFLSKWRPGTDIFFSWWYESIYVTFLNRNFPSAIGHEHEVLLRGLLLEKNLSFLGKCYLHPLSPVISPRVFKYIFFKSSTCSYYVLKEEWMMMDAMHVIFYWFRTEQELSHLTRSIYSTCTGWQLIFYRISG